MISICKRIFSKNTCPSFQRFFLCIESVLMHNTIIIDFFSRLKAGQCRFAASQSLYLAVHFVSRVKVFNLLPNKPREMCIRFYALLAKAVFILVVLTSTHNVMHCQWACVFTYILFELFKHLWLIVPRTSFTKSPWK